jgi:hypothetical protein
MITKSTSIAGEYLQQLAIDRADYAGYAKLYKSRGDVSFSGKCLNHCKVIQKPPKRLGEYNTYGLGFT